MKKLFLLRGLPGSGKSSLAKELGGLHIEADMFHINKDGIYDWKPEKVKDSHNWCHDVVENWMDMSQELIVVSNTLTQEWEMKPYYELAEKYGYVVFSLIVENRHGGTNIHNVPEDKLEQMKNRFEIKL